MIDDSMYLMVEWMNTSLITSHDLFFFIFVFRSVVFAVGDP